MVFLDNSQNLVSCQIKDGQMTIFFVLEKEDKAYSRLECEGFYEYDARRNLLC